MKPWFYCVTMLSRSLLSRFLWECVCNSFIVYVHCMYSFFLYRDMIGFPNLYPIWIRFHESNNKREMYLSFCRHTDYLYIPLNFGPGAGVISLFFQGVQVFFWKTSNNYHWENSRLNLNLVNIQHCSYYSCFFTFNSLKNSL